MQDSRFMQYRIIIFLQTFSPATSTAFVVEGPMSFDSATLTKSSVNSDASRFRYRPRETS